MHIANIMFSKGTGGIEQAFVDYTEGLIKCGHKVTAFTHPDAAVNKQLKALGIRPMKMRNMGEWDIFAMLRLKRKLARLQPDVVITHTSRAFCLSRLGCYKRIPLVGVAHNYNQRIRRMKSADAVFGITHDVIRFAIDQKIPEHRAFLIPNMIRCDTLPVHGARRSPPVIGAMGRLVAKKGFDIYIDALLLLHEKGYHFRAILGGDGEEYGALKSRIKAAGLRDIVSMPGWVDDKKAFYSTLDVFCLPSVHEPFGIVLLEAFAFGAPVVTTDSEGPREIVTPNFDALMIKRESAAELAGAIAKLLDDPALAASLAANAYVKAKTTYSIESVSDRIEKALQATIARWQRERA